MLAYLPQLIGGLVAIGVAIFICRVLIFIWRWIGLNFVFQQRVNNSNLSATIWLKTIPLLIYCGVMFFAMIAALKIWDIPAISAPLVHYGSALIAKPALFIGSLMVIAGTHVFLSRKANSDS